MLNIKFKFSNPQKALPCAEPRHMSHCALKSVQSFCCRRRQEKKEREGKERYKFTKALYFTYSWEAPCEKIFTKFCTFGGMSDIEA